ncbi:MAG: phytoene desaturase family protein [Phormidesmis sp.]
MNTPMALPNKQLNQKPSNETITNDCNTYDAIIIGSGIGGLTTAALLSKCFKKKVLVLEQHFKPGGFTHAFQRKGKFCWDVGLHYVGEMAPGSLARSAFDYLSEGRLAWQKMPDPFEHFVYPDFTFKVSSNPKQYLADLIHKFPQEASSLWQYFQDVEKASSWVVTNAFLEVIPPVARRLVKIAVKAHGNLAKETTQCYLDRNFKDNRLKSLLTSQWGDYGLPPSKSSFGIHSVVVNHYLKGAWYPVGGSEAIVKALLPTIERSGGVVKTRHKVTEIVLTDDEVQGVQVHQVSGSNPKSAPLESIFYRSPVVISGVGAYNTFLKLIPDCTSLSERDSMLSIYGQNCEQTRGQDKDKSTIVTLYLGLKESPRKLGFKGENHWIYKTYNHEHKDNIDSLKKGDRATASNAFSSCYLTFPSLKDPLAKGNTAEIIASVDYTLFEQWAHYPWKKRGEQYETLKSRISNSLIQLIEKQYSGFQDLIEYQELATPLTFQYFVNNQQGEIYGTPFTAHRFDQTWAQASTSLKNLYLTGADTFTPGLVGAMWGGVKAAGLTQGILGFPTIMLAILTAK